MYSPHGREDLRPQFAVEDLDLLGSPWPLRLLIFRRHQHGRDQGARARSGDHVEVVRDPGIIPIQLLRRDQVNYNPLFQYLTDQHSIDREEVEFELK